MSRAWQLNIPGMIFYGVVFFTYPLYWIANNIVGFLSNDEEVRGVINFLAEETILFDVFSEFDFSGNLFIAAFAIYFLFATIALVSYQICIHDKKSPSDNDALWLARAMYIPMMLLFGFVFVLSLLIAVYFYPNV